MGKYTGPKHRLARREGINIIDKQSRSLERRLTIPPGVHGKKRKRALSEFGQQLREKQKAKVMYGLLEKQFRNLVKKVQKRKGESGELLISLLETRLDNVVYRLGFAKSRYQSRQFVSHGHVVVNGKKVTIPSYSVKKDDVISLADKTLKQPVIAQMLLEEVNLLPYLSREKAQGKVLRTPKREDLQVPFDTQLIIEYYSR